jgi:glutathione S-transferase
MLDLKRIDYELVGVIPGLQRIHLRLAGFRGGTVPALKLDGRRVQGSRTIARALERLQSEPPLFPADAHARARVEEAERWGEEELQAVPRLIFRWGLVRHAGLRTWLARQSGLPAPGIAAIMSLPAAQYYAHAIDADEAAVRRRLAELPGLLDHADALLAEGVLSTAPPNAATLQVLSSVRALDALADLHDHLSPHPCAAAARELFPDYPGSAPPFLPPDWLGALTSGADTGPA